MHLSLDCSVSRVSNLCWVPIFVFDLLSQFLCVSSLEYKSRLVSTVFGSRSVHVFLFLKPVLSGLCLRLSGSGGPRLFFFFFFFRFPFVYSVVMASEVTQAHVAAKRSQPSLGLTGKAVRAASPRPGLANGPAARWGSRFPALQAAHAYCSGSPSPLGVRDCGSPRCAAGGSVCPTLSYVGL